MCVPFILNSPSILSHFAGLSVSTRPKLFFRCIVFLAPDNRPYHSRYIKFEGKATARHCPSLGRVVPYKALLERGRKWRDCKELKSG